MTRRFQQVLDPYGITPLHWGVLCCLWAEDGLRTSQIAQRLEQLGGTITVGLDSMEKRTLIRREKDARDGRISQVFLTKHGRELEPTLRPKVQLLIQSLFASLSEADYQRLSIQIQGLRQEIAKLIRE